MESWTKEVVFSDKFVPRPQWGAREPNGITSFRFDGLFFKNFSSYMSRGLECLRKC